LRERPAEDWVEALGGAGVPVGKVRSVPEALASAAAAGRPATAPPLLGEHTKAVLRELGRTDEEIAALLERGVAAQAGASSNEEAPT
jgi:crotonobetainyl-CoA:carnitine CoA-transferase CaiB-like acyl-CoA transferase